ncbi:HAMP domain-containing sensor histidine kinase [Marinobacter sp. ATCH36]|uniref:sensor histidine kinase n=1 Tax=Marinobacter sp. ATCH36 TaxID=2945106 RepID=UPI002021CA89|nr:HAMP domain-containing sensor histidine kinase [Marinobacter sp. ATCH36]MCL7944219.1 HAMP domain-containing histidine kinase [Marinobacter sp. ATCH36]
MSRKSSLSRRLFRAMLLIGVINVAITLFVSEIIYEDLEEASLNIGLAAERAYFEERIAGDQVSSWTSALVIVLFVPEAATDVEIPSLFRGRPIPYADEVDIEDKTYLISIARTESAPGVLYLAQDITLLERQEESFQQVTFILFALSMLAISLALAKLGSARIIRPLQTLSEQIKTIRPDSSLKRIPAQYADEELNEIARVLNEMLKELDTYVRREKALVSLASHELRTPIAVISGALDVIDQRAPDNPANRRTLDRIRQATDKMHADVDALLKLAHRSSGQDKPGVVDLGLCVHRVKQELENSTPEYAGRVEHTVTREPATIEADQTLVHMLLRNLVQNALRHTRGCVYVSIDNDRLSVSDTGEGLPSHVRAKLDSDADELTVPEEGLGLFIVRLICERLNWQTRVQRSGATGTQIDILFQLG